MKKLQSAAVFMDRDGTIIEDRGSIKDNDQVKFLPGAFEALRKLQKHFLLFIVTNQGSAGLSDRQITAVNNFVRTQLADQDIKIQKIYTCNHLETIGCKCRKPSPFFLKKAAKDYQIDLQRSFVIGDHPCDVQLAQNAGAHGIYVLTGHGNKHCEDLPEETDIASGIMEAAERVISCHLDAMPSRSGST